MDLQPTYVQGLAKQARREALRFAVQQVMFCPHCERVLDVGSTVLLEDTKRAKYSIACVQCSERAPFDGTLGCIEVYDGRVLFAKPKRASRRKAK